MHNKYIVRSAFFTDKAFPTTKVTFTMTSSDFTGCWLGDPNGEQVWIEGAEQGKVLASEFISGTPSKLAIHLMTVLFMETQLRTGNCTPTPSGRPLLDQRTINGIRLISSILLSLCIHSSFISTCAIQVPRGRCSCMETHHTSQHELQVQDRSRQEICSCMWRSGGLLAMWSQPTQLQFNMQSLLVQLYCSFCIVHSS